MDSQFFHKTILHLSTHFPIPENSEPDSVIYKPFNYLMLKRPAKHLGQKPFSHYIQHVALLYSPCSNEG